MGRFKWSGSDLEIGSWQRLSATCCLAHFTMFEKRPALTSKNILKRVFSRISRGDDKPLNYDEKLWSKQAQQGELEFHKKDRKRQSTDFNKNSRLLFEHFGLPREQFRGGTVIDLGAGSKLRTKYFSESRIVAIEPLAERFMAEIPWCDLRDADAIYSTPAEERVEECIGTADLIVSINVLDHCFNFDQIIGNIRAYLKPNGIAFLSFDEHKYRDPMHPLILSDEICRDVFVSQGLKVDRHSQGFGESKDISKGKDTYGHGDYCLNYWLSPA